MAPYAPETIPSEDWLSGGRSISGFLPWSEHRPTAANDPAKVKLPKPHVVCVVGASRGIGAHVALSYVKAGASGLVLAARRISGLEETAAKCKEVNPDIELEIVSCDITSAESVADLATKTQERFGRLDVVVANSGLAGPPIVKVTDDDPKLAHMTMDVNYIGTFYAAKYLIPLLLQTENGAKDFIGINTAASLVIRGPVANAKYCVSKMAQMRLIEMIHEQFSGEGLGAYSLHPGAVQTEMSTDAPDSFKDSLIDSVDLAGAWCVWLTKDAQQKWLSGRWISGNWPVEGLLESKDDIVKRDLLKMVLAV